MAADASGRNHKDDEILVGRGGIPNFLRAMTSLVKEYRRRVLFAYSNLEGSGGDEAKEKKSLEKKKARFGRRFLDALQSFQGLCGPDFGTGEVDGV